MSYRSCCCYVGVIVIGVVSLMMMRKLMSDMMNINL